MNKPFENVVRKLKKINKIIIDGTNFILLLPVYYIGAGLAFLLWKIFNKEKRFSKKTYWIDSSAVKEKLDEYLKQF